MFEDVLKVRPNVKQEIKDLLVGQVDKAFARKIDEEQDEETLRAMNKFKEAVDSKLDDFVKLYTEHFTTDEMIVMLDWAKSDLGIRAEEFNADYIIPQSLGLLENVIDEMVEEDMAKSDEYFANLEAQLEEKTAKDEWEVEVELEDE